MEVVLEDFKRHIYIYIIIIKNNIILYAIKSTLFMADANIIVE